MVESNLVSVLPITRRSVTGSAGCLTPVVDISLDTVPTGSKPAGLPAQYRAM